MHAVGRAAVGGATVCVAASQRARRVHIPRAASTSAQMVVPPKIPQPGQLRGVLFDIDGTLTDSDHLHFEVFQSFLVELGYQGGKPIDDAFFMKNICGRHNPDIFSDLFPEKTPDEHHALAEDKEARYRQLARSKLKPLTGLPEFAEWLKKNNFRRAAVTNAPRANAEMMLESLGLTDFFEALVIGAECERAKPNPDPYLEGLRLVGLKPEEAIAFEDSPSGMAAAAAAGLATFGVLTTQPAEKLMAKGAVMCIQNFADPKFWEAIGEKQPQGAAAR